MNTDTSTITARKIKMFNRKKRKDGKQQRGARLNKKMEKHKEKKGGIMIKEKSSQKSGPLRTRVDLLL